MAKNRNLLSKILFLLQPFLLTTCFYSMNGCNSNDVKKSVVPGLEADYLVLNEKILLNFFGGPDEKEWAIKTLEKRCEDEEDPHACYNLSTHLFSLKEFSKSKKFAEKAIFLNPNDSLYFEMYRQTLIESGKFDSKNKNSKPDTSILFTKLQIECRNNKQEDAFLTVSEMLDNNLLSYESIQNGLIKECLNERMISDLSQKSKRNKINFSNFYYTEKNKSNLFYSIWDTSYLTQRKPLEREEELKYRITVYWRDFRKAVASQNKKLAQKNLNEFLKELNQEKTNAKKDTNLFIAIERAAKLLIEQDDFFAKYKNLAEEF
ncbi:MAG: hypothetical protein IPL26_02825 [Leptospiraceae bacterium]|nr:hypothetical protein [Leptospiraceae bacterium]